MESYDGDPRVEYRVQTVTEQSVYHCPRGISIHRGDPGKCGKECNKTLRTLQLDSDYKSYRDEDGLEITQIKSRTTIVDSILSGS